MIRKEAGPVILVVEDVHETRDGIEKLLTADGYRVSLARDEADAVESAKREQPNLILVSLAGSPLEVIAGVRRICHDAGITNKIPVVLFCIGELSEGDEIAIGENVHLTRPDNFNQLRDLLSRLLDEVPRAA